MARGLLRIYLGAAPGVGKTYAMLNEGWRRHQRGTDVVVGLYETHGRPRHRRRRSATSRSSRASRSSTAARRSRRWTSTRSWPASPTSHSSTSSRTPTCPARATRSAGRTSKSCSTPGIDVISTLNIQHLESVNDVVERITGVKQQETIPDAIVRQAEQVELVDMTPEAMRRRMAHGNIYPGRARRRVAGQLLPPGQPGRAARDRPALGRGPGRGEPPAVPGGPRHRGHAGRPASGCSSR